MYCQKPCSQSSQKRQHGLNQVVYFLIFAKKDIMVLSDQVASQRRKPDVSVTYIKTIKKRYIKTTKHKETISDSTAVHDLIGKYWQLLIFLKGNMAQTK